MRNRNIIAGSAFAVTCITLGGAYFPETVQAALPAPHMDRPGDEAWSLPEYKPDAAIPGLTLPEAGTAPDPVATSRQIMVAVNRIIVTGNSAIPTDELATVTLPYEGRRISTEELQELRRKLTRYYIDKGYINSGAYIPDQEVVDGNIEIRIVEGGLTEIRIEGNEKLHIEYIEERIRLASGPPLNINTLQQSLLLLQQDPLIETIHAELKPGTLPGQSVLETRVVESLPYQFSFGVNNDRPPSIGAERVELGVIHRNLTGFADRLNANLGVTEGLDDFSIRYDIPVNARDTRIGISYERGDSGVIEAPFDTIDIRSAAENIGVSITHPLYRTPNEELYLGLSLERRKSQTYMLGTPFSFSSGAVDGRSVVTVLRFSQEWTQRTRSSVQAVRSSFNFGIDTLDSSVNHNSEDGKFVSWLGQYQMAKRNESNGHEVVFRFDTQLTNDPLLPLEQFAIGGINTVRGYRNNQLVRDNGVVLSLEYRIPLFSESLGKQKLQLAPFYDFGRSWNRERPTARPEDISSVGLGLRWAPRKNIFAELYWGKPLRTVDTPNNDDLQDKGIHFKMNMYFPASD